MSSKQNLFIPKLGKNHNKHMMKPKHRKSKVNQTEKGLKTLKNSVATKTCPYTNKERSYRQYGGKIEKHLPKILCNTLLVKDVVDDIMLFCKAYKHKAKDLFSTYLNIR